MGKEDRKTEKPAEQAQGQLPTAEKLQVELDQSASFQALVEAAAPALDKITAGWTQVLEGIAACEKLQLDQKAAVGLAREHATKHGIASEAIELGHNPLVAHSWERIAKLPLPSVDIPSAYVRHFLSDHDRMTATQVILNQGTTVLAPHAERSQVHEALLSGVRPSDIQSARVPLDELNKRAKSWFGFRPGH